MKQILETSRLLLTELTCDDLPVLEETLRSPAVTAVYQHSFSPEDAVQWLECQQKRYQQDGFGLWAVRRKADGAFVGQAGLTWQDCEGVRVLEAGWMVHPAFEGQGYASEAARGCIRHAFSVLGAEEVCAIIRPENLSSIHVAQALGMRVRKRFTAVYFAGPMEHLLFSLSKDAPLLSPPPKGILIRDYKPEYCAAMASLFHETVHLAAARDYSPPQLDAWSPAPPDPALWNPSFLEHRTLVALMGETVVGFGDMTWEGYLDRLYVSAHHQGMGIASAICDRLEAPFQGQRITVHASITARPFFEKRGYRVLRQQQVARRGQLLTNFVMERPGSVNFVQ